MKYLLHWRNEFPQFIECKDSCVQDLIQSATLAKFSVGQQIFGVGYSCDHYLLLIAGLVKAQLLSENGREILLYQVRPGDSCVLTTSCLLAGGECYPAEAYAQEDSTAFVIPSSSFSRCIAQSQFFREFVFNNFAERLSNVLSKMDEVVFSGIDARLAKELLIFNESQVKITHQELATKLGSVREVVSRHLKQFETNGWVSLGRGTVSILDSEALNKLV